MTTRLQREANKPLRRMPRWKTAAQRLTRYRRCMQLDAGGAGGAVVCERPWQPGDSALFERMGPVRRPCLLCDLHRELTHVMSSALRREMAADEARRLAMTYREACECDHALMSIVEQAEQGLTAHPGALVIALMVLREHGSVEASLEELSNEKYKTDEVFFAEVRTHLRPMDVRMSERWQRHTELVGGAR